MRNKNLVLSAAVACLLAFSCSKEEVNVNKEPVNIVTEAGKNLAQRVMQQGMQNIGKQTKAQIKERCMQSQRALSSHPNYSRASEGEMQLLADVMYTHEALFNQQYGNLMSEFSDLKTEYFELELPLRIESEEKIYVLNEDIDRFYDQVAHGASELLEGTELTLIFSDFKLDNIDMSSGVGSVSIGVSMSPSNVWLTPGVGYSSFTSGPCNSSGPIISNGNGPTDATPFIAAYANQHAPWRLNPPSANPLIMFAADYSSDNPTEYTPSVVNWNSQIEPYFFQGPYTCIGLTNQDWYNEYTRISKIVNHTLPLASLVHHDAEFIVTNFTVRNGPTPYISAGKYHGGEFYYGLVFP